MRHLRTGRQAESRASCELRARLSQRTEGNFALILRTFGDGLDDLDVFDPLEEPAKMPHGDGAHDIVAQHPAAFASMQSATTKPKRSTGNTLADNGGASISSPA